MLQVVVPPGMGPGQQLQVSANGTMLAVTIPQASAREWHSHWCAPHSPRSKRCLCPS